MKQRINYPELGIPLVFLLLAGWYLSDAYKASASVENLLLILPAAVVVMLLCLWIVAKVFLSGRSRDEEVAEEEENAEEPETRKVSVFGAMLILAGYILLMDWIGFDVATFMFIAALMFLQGERRIAWLGGFSAVFALLVSIFFEYMIPYPMPMLLGREFLEKLL